MIDERKIQAAAERSADTKYTTLPDMLAYVNGFRCGADWLMQSLWHGMDEEPEFGKGILVCDGKDIKFTIWHGSTAVIDFEKGYDFLSDWKAFAAYYPEILMWCYPSDLLPIRLIRPIKQ